MHLSMASNLFGHIADRTGFANVRMRPTQAICSNLLLMLP